MIMFHVNLQGCTLEWWVLPDFLNLCLWKKICLLIGNRFIDNVTFQGTNMSNLRKRKIIFNSTFVRGYVSSQEGIYNYPPWKTRKKFAPENKPSFPLKRKGSGLPFPTILQGRWFLLLVLEFWGISYRSMRKITQTFKLVNYPPPNLA